jgi:hypothetical protein
MNERMTKLHVAAARYAKELYPNDIVEWSMCMSEKFAELIVSECVRVCNKQTPNWKGEYATAFGDGVEFCISGIKEHFGVEE